MSDSYWNARGCGLDWFFLVFAFLGVSRPNASTCSPHTHYNRVRSVKEKKKSSFCSKTLFHTENSFKFAKTKDNWNERCFNMKVANLWKATVGWCGGEPDRPVSQQSSWDKGLKAFTFHPLVAYDIYSHFESLPFYESAPSVRTSLQLLVQICHMTECKCKFMQNFQIQYKFATAR